MTAGWAALNTLRETTWEIAGCGDIRFTHDIERAKREHEDAVALVEAALNAAEPLARHFDSGFTCGSLRPEMQALAAALRAVREGK